MEKEKNRDRNKSILTLPEKGFFFKRFIDRLIRKRLVLRKRRSKELTIIRLK